MTKKEADRYSGALPFWNHLSEEEKQAVCGSMCLKRFPRGSLIDSTYSACYGFLGVLSGRLKVYVVSEEGREITLYKVESGECGVMAATRAIKGADLPLNIMAGADTELLLIGATTYSRLTQSNVYVRSFTYETITKRLTEALWVMREIVFTGFDRRLAGYLAERCERDAVCHKESDVLSGQPFYEIITTQDAVAEDVNSAREVVARMLKRFAAAGYVEVKRGSIVVKDVEALKRM